MIQWFPTIFWHHEVFFTSWRVWFVGVVTDFICVMTNFFMSWLVFHVMTHLFDFLASWHHFWRHDVIFDVMTYFLFCLMLWCTFPCHDVANLRQCSPKQNSDCSKTLEQNLIQILDWWNLGPYWKGLCEIRHSLNISLKGKHWKMVVET